MRTNRIKDIWASGGAAINGWVQIRDSYATEVMAHQGWDSMTLDLQHSYIDMDKAIPLLQAISTTDVVPMVRVPALNPADIMLALDAGAYGIICPMINNRDQAEAFVSACRYPPDGERSVGPLRALLYGGADYMEGANDQIIAIAMIETPEAVENLDEILDTPGLDAIYIGPSDLSISHGYPPTADVPAGTMSDLIADILAAAKQRHIVAGIHNYSAEFAARRGLQGFQLLTVGSDARFLAMESKSTVDSVRSGLAKGQEERP